MVPKVTAHISNPKSPTSTLMLNRKRGRMLEGRKGKTRCNNGAMSRVFTTVIQRDKIMNKSLDIEIKYSSVQDNNNT